MTLPPPHQSMPLAISDPSTVGEARRFAAGLAASLGFDAATAGKLALVVTECGTNLVHHAGGGELVFRVLVDGDNSGLELLAIDSGPGMRNVTQCFEDGYSTRGTPGTGLGGIVRQSSTFDVFSMPGRGTVMLAQLWARAPEPAAGAFTAGAVCIPVSGEDVCGDAWSVVQRAGRAVVLILDGLGHGQGAADAALAALAAFHRHEDRAPAELIETLHGALRSTRGAAVGAAELSLAEGALRFAGVGNCSGSILGAARAAHLTSYNGTVGAQIPRIQQLSYEFPSDALLVVHTDGLTTRWNLDDYPGLAQRHPSVIAAVLYRDHARKRDDATVLALRKRGSYAVWQEGRPA